MFVESAATDTLQGRAIQNKNEKWGRDDVPRYPELESRHDTNVHIGVPVCKKKYAPFTIHRKGKKIVVERMYGCHCHSHIRKKLIEKFGERKGWEPFGQWSLRKAEETARKMRLIEIKDIKNENNRNEYLKTTASGDKIQVDEQITKLKTFGPNGSCAWRLRGKYDDIQSELQDAMRDLKS